MRSSALRSRLGVSLAVVMLSCGGTDGRPMLGGDQPPATAVGSDAGDDASPVLSAGDAAGPSTGTDDAQTTQPICDGDWILPDPTGFVASTSNLSGITGAWSLHRDCDDPALLEAGTPVPGQTCSLVMSPAPGGPFIPQMDSFDMCTSGATAHVLSDLALATEWGAYITLPLNAPSGVQGDYDATALRGFCVFLSGDVVPTLRLRFPTDQGLPSDDWYQVTVQHEGWHQVLFQDLAQISRSGPPFDPSKLKAIEIEIPSSRAESIPWDFCVDAVVALR